VRSYTKYKKIKPTEKRREVLTVILAVICCAFLGWLWWQSGKPSNKVMQSDSKTNRLDVTDRQVRTARTDLVSTNKAETPAALVTNISAAVLEPAIGKSAEPTSIPKITNSPTAPFTQRLPRNPYEAQVALVRRGLSPGCLDGAIGTQTRAALRAFQEREHLPVTGDLDPATKARLLLVDAPEKVRLITTNDLVRLSPVGSTWLAKSQQQRLDYETILELLAEEGQAHPNLIRMLNPSINWTNVEPGASVLIPNVQFPVVRGKAAFIRIRLSDKNLQAWDSSSNLLAHTPCSIARSVEKRPVGQLFVEKIALRPNYRFDPEVFPESAEGRKLRRPLIIPPGPNSPVGTAWIGLNRPGYGIHGTPRPEEVGRTESHGCFRLPNWSAEFVAQLVRVGTPVFVEP
jgi:lipoprotein-anchoring transpeptidase ErfK/SrfK